MSKRSSFGNMVRRRLSDITNFQPHSKSPENFPHDVSSAKDFIDHLVKEKMAMVKLIQDKNKIIEFSGIEIRKLRTCLQKMQLQNWNLAQSNTHMLAELTMGRERLKALQHEVVCKEALIKANKSSLEGKYEVHVQNTDFQEPETITEEPEINEDIKCCSAGTRRRVSRSRSLGGSTINRKHAEKETVLSKRRCLRRQSAGSRITNEEPPTDRNLFDINDAKFLVVGSSSRPTREAGPNRPMRKSVEKVQSYKEIPLNVKMRRSG